MSSLLKKKKKTVENSQFADTTNVSATATRTNPMWVEEAVKGFAGDVGAFGQTDPKSLVAGPNALQTAAGEAAAKFGGGTGFEDASTLIKSTTGKGPSTYDAVTSTATQFGGVKLDPTTTYGGTKLGPTTQVDAAQFGGAKVDPTKTFDATALEAAKLYGGTKVGEATQYGGTKVGEASQIGDVRQVRGESVLDNLSAYMSPYTQDVVDTTLADFDVDAGRTRAQQALDLAGAGAFGGSGAAITQSMTEGELARARASTAATLRDTGFSRGAALSSEDAARRQQAGGMNAQLDFEKLRANTDALNQRNLTQGQFDQQTGLANTDALNTRNLTQSQLDQQTGLTNTAAENERNLTQGQLTQDAAKTNANAENNRILQQAQMDQQAGLTNTDAINRARQINAASENERTLTQGQLDQQAGLEAARAANERSITQGQLDQQTGLSNTGALNDFALANSDAENAARKFGAEATDRSLDRDQNAAMALADIASAYGADQRDSAMTQAEIGAMLRDIEQANLMAPAELLKLRAQLMAGIPFDLFGGEAKTATTNASGTKTATTKTTESDPMGQLSKILDSVSAFMPRKT